ncbi:MAG: hypothetical protein DRN71_04255 [Candidatus Nanohalarchaeota archaeon]|nr:MAG: hypothetical protein DRN71_04255 [Candidatus Nanohaloarchaeota archaeon]
MSYGEITRPEDILRVPDDVFNKFLPEIVQAYVEGENHPTNPYGIVSPEPHPTVMTSDRNIEILIPTTTVSTGGGVNAHPITIMERRYSLSIETFESLVTQYQEQYKEMRADLQH